MTDKRRVETMDNATLVVYANAVCRSVAGESNDVNDDKASFRSVGRLIGAGPEMMSIIAEMSRRLIDRMTDDEKLAMQAISKTYQKLADDKLK